MFIIGLRNPLTGCMKNTKEALIGIVVSPTFMIGIWHECDWLKKDLVQPNLRSGGSGKSLTWLDYAYINNNSFSFGISCVNVIFNMWFLWLFYTCYFVGYMLVISMVHDKIWLFL